MKSFIKLPVLTVITVSLCLNGCATLNPPSPDDPRYMPVYPTMPEPRAANNGSIYQENTAMVLFEDNRARRVGDILTIRLIENTQGKKKANNKQEKTQDTTVTNPTLFGRAVDLGGKKNLGSSLNSSDSFEGKGSADQSNTLTGTISVTVAQVLSNGNLVVRGEKWVQINRGQEYIRLTGIVRPRDVDPENMVDSTKVADARISYSGTGQLAEANTAGWLGRFFMGALSVFPF